MTYYAALDVSLRLVAVCIIDDQGDFHFEAKIPSEVESSGVRGDGRRSIQNCPLKRCETI